MICRSSVNILVVIGIIIVILVATAPTLMIGYSQPDRTRQVTGSGDSVLRFTCPNGQPPSLFPGHINDIIQFSASQNNRQVSGTWTIFSLYEDMGVPPNTSKGGTITGGQIAGNHYTLTGIETFDNTCGGPIPTEIVIDGKCTTGSGRIIQIQFTASNGERGTFSGSAQCS
jgi:hypothetical protein